MARAPFLKCVSIHNALHHLLKEPLLQPEPVLDSASRGRKAPVVCQALRPFCAVSVQRVFLVWLPGEDCPARSRSVLGLVTALFQPFLKHRSVTFGKAGSRGVCGTVSHLVQGMWVGWAKWCELTTLELIFLADVSSETYNAHDWEDGMLSGLLEETVLFLLKAEDFF